MSRVVVSQIGGSYERILKVEPYTYSYKPEAGWAWLQRICFRFLQWRKINHVSERYEYSTFEFDSDDFIENLFDACISVEDQFSQRPKSILVGSEYMNKLKLSCTYSARSGAPPFTARYCRQETDDDGRPYTAFCDIQVHVVPNMKGWVALPHWLEVKENG